MDPNTTLDELRELVEAANRNDELLDWQLVAEELADRFAALDQWLSRGGFLPTDWNALRK